VAVGRATAFGGGGEDRMTSTPRDCEGRAAAVAPCEGEGEEQSKAVARVTSRRMR
jgi:hypothetical protein